MQPVCNTVYTDLLARSMYYKVLTKGERCADQ